MSASFEAVVDEIREQQRVAGRSLWQMALDETRFVPGDHGLLLATSRSGTALEIPVLEVSTDLDGRLWHTVEKPLAAGTRVTGRVGAGGPR